MRKLKAHTTQAIWEILVRKEKFPFPGFLSWVKPWRSIEDNVGRLGVPVVTAMLASDRRSFKFLGRIAGYNNVSREAQRPAAP